MATKKDRTSPPAKARPMRRSTDIEDVRFPTRAVVGLVLFTAALVASQWATAYSLRADIAAIVQRMEAQEKIDATTDEAARTVAATEKRVLDDKLLQLENMIKGVERDYKLEDYDIKALISGGRK